MEPSEEQVNEALPQTGLRTSPESVRQEKALCETPGTSRTSTRGSLRFGSLSHHSFFSRHNPHPHRVRHMQGEPLRTHRPVQKHACVCHFREVFLLKRFLKSKLTDEEVPRRKTQYSAQSGRIIPASSWGGKKRSSRTSHKRAQRWQTQSLEGVELKVLELLCQILQTDSLSMVQQWLLLASDKGEQLPFALIDLFIKSKIISVQTWL
uniref:Thymus, brain and testes associated n=1 Tax=Sinocyclocheilus anshuiensis TaxID=1608454 RepID=A0A671NQI1_9TELE